MPGAMCSRSGRKPVQAPSVSTSCHRLPVLGTWALAWLFFWVASRGEPTPTLGSGIMENSLFRLYFSTLIYVSVGMWAIYHNACRSQDSLWELVISFHNLSAGNGTQVVRPSIGSFHPLSHLSSTKTFIFFISSFRGCFWFAKKSGRPQLPLLFCYRLFLIGILRKCDIYNGWIVVTYSVFKFLGFYSFSFYVCKLLPEYVSGHGAYACSTIKRPEEAIVSPGTGVRGGCEWPCGAGY